MDNNKLNKIFANSDCISNQLMINYIDDKLSEKDKNMVEMHLQSCEFCRDEFEGLSSMVNKERLPEIVYELNKEITIKTHGRKRFALFPQVSAMAAIILLLVGFVWFFFYIIHLRPDSLRIGQTAQSLEAEKEKLEMEKEQMLFEEEMSREKDTIPIEKPRAYSVSKEEPISASKSLHQNMMAVKSEKEDIEMIINEISDTDKADVIVVVTEEKKLNRTEEVKGDLAMDDVKAANMEVTRSKEKVFANSKSKRLATDEPENIYQQGIVAFENKDYKKAIELFLESAKKDSNKAKQYYFIGQSYQNIGNDNRAISWYDKVIEIPGNQYIEMALWNKSQIQLKMGQKTKAIETLNQTRAMNGMYQVPAQNQIDSLKRK